MKPSHVDVPMASPTAAQQMSSSASSPSLMIAAAPAVSSWKSIRKQQRVATPLSAPAPATPGAASAPGTADSDQASSSSAGTSAAPSSSMSVRTSTKTAEDSFGQVAKNLQLPKTIASYNAALVTEATNNNPLFKPSGDMQAPGVNKLEPSGAEAAAKDGAPDKPKSEGGDEPKPEAEVGFADKAKQALARNKVGFQKQVFSHVNSKCLDFLFLLV